MNYFVVLRAFFVVLCVTINYNYTKLHEGCTKLHEGLLRHPLQFTTYFPGEKISLS